MIDATRRWSFDWLLAVLTLLLLGLGLVMIRSATSSIGSSGLPLHEWPVVRQSAFAVIGLAALVAASLVNYRVWGALRWVLYVAMLAGLVAVLLVGRVFFGAQSWFDLQGFILQPSELCKIVLIIVLARYFAGHEAHLRQGLGVLVSLLLTLPLVALVYIQPDMGTAVVLVSIWLGMLFVAGIRLRHLLLLGFAALLLAPVLWAIMQPHMRERVLMFLNPHTDPLKKDYNVIQALISVGSGGLWGKGLGQGTQNQLFFLRVRHTDFIFAVLAEELGFVGAMLLLTLFAGLLMRILRTANQAGDAFGRLLASGVATMIFVHAAINIGFHVGLLPVTGLPLPLISYGGSSLITTLIGLGLVESVARYHDSSEATNAQVIA